jgi:hypothetical protein
MGELFRDGSALVNLLLGAAVFVLAVSNINNCTARYRPLFVLAAAGGFYAMITFTLVLLHAYRATDTIPAEMGRPLYMVLLTTIGLLLTYLRKSSGGCA